MTFASATLPSGPMRTSTSTTPPIKASGGRRGAIVPSGNGVSGDEGDARSFGASPSVGAFSEGGRNRPPTTSTIESTRSRRGGMRGRRQPGAGLMSRSAGENCQECTASVIASVNGGVDRMHVERR